jgi:cytochrome-b5 reductase
MFASRLTQSTARRTYATVPAGQSSSRLPIAVLAAALLGGAYYYSANGKLPEPKDVKAAEEKAASALKGAGASMSALPAALDPKEFKNFKLTRIEPYNHNSSTFHFELRSWTSDWRLFV